MRFYFFILTLMFSLSSLGSNDCTSVNLVTQKSSPFQKIPVYDQDGVGICYAYAASQLADYHLIKKGQASREIHPLWAAMKFAEFEGQQKITSGRSRDTLSALKTYGNCPYEKVEEAIKAWGKKNNIAETDVIKHIEKEMPKKTKETSIKAKCESCRGPSLIDQFNTLLKSYSSITTRAIFFEMLEPYCSKVTKISIPKVKFFKDSNDDDYLKELNKKLDNFKEPVSITYCSKVLYDPKYEGVSRSFWISTLKDEKTCGHHESIIVGKKSVAGSCHYLLRNSWGSGFGEATKNWNCLCKNKKTGKMVDDCNQKTHNTGEYTVQGCWISGNSLKKNISVLTTLN